MSDLISRQAAIDATWFESSYTDPLNVLTEVRDRLKALPSAQPEPLSDAYMKAVWTWLLDYQINVATMDKLTSAVLYLDVLEELKKHGYVLVDMREVTE